MFIYVIYYVLIYKERIYFIKYVGIIYIALHISINAINLVNIFAFTIWEQASMVIFIFLNSNNYIEHYHIINIKPRSLIQKNIVEKYFCFKYKFNSLVFLFCFQIKINVTVLILI